MFVTIVAAASVIMLALVVLQFGDVVSRARGGRRVSRLGSEYERLRSEAEPNHEVEQGSDLERTPQERS